MLECNILCISCIDIISEYNQVISKKSSLVPYKTDYYDLFKYIKDSCSVLKMNVRRLNII